MVNEAQLDDTGAGLVPRGDGWFVLNARDSRWFHAEGRPALCFFESGEPDWPQLGINICVLWPGQPMARYHWEADQEDFLVLSGEALLIAEGEERPLRQWDFVHTPAHADHTIVGAGEGKSVIVAAGARVDSVGDNWGGYPVHEAAVRHDASAEHETNEPKEAYARFPGPRPTKFEAGWLP